MQFEGENLILSVLLVLPLQKITTRIWDFIQMLLSIIHKVLLEGIDQPARGQVIGLRTREHFKSTRQATSLDTQHQRFLSLNCPIMNHNV